MAKIPILVFLGIVTFYLVLPIDGFPVQPSDSVQSLEGADTETVWRRGYFTNYTREEVREHYRRQIGWSFVLNYPPEDATSIIRDQTRSTGLEEIVQPFRESLFINYFEPKKPKDAVSYQGVHYLQKITVKYSPTNFFVRLIVVFTGLGLLFLILKETGSEIKKWISR